MHRAVARRLARDAGRLDVARRRLAQLRSVNVHGRTYHDRGAALLEGSLEQLLRAMTGDFERGATTRKEPPFTTPVTPAECLRAFADIR
jgi:hypothetical protein